MKRREFLQRLGWGLAAGWALSRWPRPTESRAGSAGCRIATLADAHLLDGDPRRPEAQALARAVAEIRAWRPAPDLVLFAGDLAHDGNPRALALGREILAELPVSPLMVMGEGDGRADEGRAWRRIFGEPGFSRTVNDYQVIGLHTAWSPGPGGPVFRLGEAQRRRLAQELARLDPETPLLILSHAPLTPLFRPWQQWTADGDAVMALLSRFRQALCLHGHVHRAGVGGQGLEIGNFENILSFPGPHKTENRKPKTENHLSLPPTAWPLPLPQEGTPAAPRPGLGPQGCGWGRLALGPHTLEFQPQQWQA